MANYSQPGQGLEPITYDTQPSPLPNRSNSQHTYRARGIPINYSVNVTRELLRSVLNVETRYVQIRSLAIDPDRKSKTATIDFVFRPACLSVDRNEWSFEIPDAEINAADGDGIGDEDFIPSTPTLTIDTHFKGITTLKSFKDPVDHKIDCIAIGGLGGHALGSFKARGTSYTWLRDSLPKHLPGARIMLYGYDTQISGSYSFQDLEALATTLRSHLQILATREDPTHTTPLIFIAHSLGGILVKGAIIQLKRDPDGQAMLASIYGALFFGVPNQGIDNGSLVAMVKDQPNQALVYSLGKESQILREQCRSFSEAFHSRHSKVVCFYETMMSPTAEFVGTQWEMTGPRCILVNSSSATHGRHWEIEAHHVQPLNRTHSDLVKFSPHDADYDRVLGVLKDMENAAILPRTARDDHSETRSVSGNQTPRLGGSLLSPIPALSSVMSNGEPNLQPAEEIQQGKQYLDRDDMNTLWENRCLAKEHFLNALAILNDTRADASEFIQVYNGLLHAHLDLTYHSGLGMDDREDYLRTAINYNNQSLGIAQRLPIGQSWILAQVKLQQAVLRAREVQFRVKRGIEGSSRNLTERNTVIDEIEWALGRLRESDHPNKEKSIAWGRQFQDRLRRM